MMKLASIPALIKKTLMLIVQSIVEFIRKLKASPYAILTIIAVLIYGLVFSYFTTLKHSLFLTSGWDLGVFDQALYTTINSGKLFYYTADLFLNPVGCYFAQHVSPILFLVLPFYAIGSSSITLLVLKSFILAFGALPLYLLARELLESPKAGFMVGIAYLLYVPLQGSNWFDFQPQIFLPVLFFSMFYFAIKSKWNFYFLTTTLTVMVEEHISLLVFLVATYLLLTSKVRPFWQSLKSFRSMNRNLASVITMAFSILYFFVAGWIKSSFPINPELTYMYKALQVFSVLGVKADPITFPLYALLNPGRAFAALLYDFPLKFLYLVLLFGPLLFLSFKSKVVIITIPFLGLFLLSNYNAYYSVGSHYPLYVLGFIFVAALMVLKRLQHAARMSILRTVLIVSMLFTISISPLSPLSTPFIKEGLLWYPLPAQESQEKISSLEALVNVIPPNASVLTQNNIFPHVSNRPNAFVIPISDIMNDTRYLQSLVNSSEYILLDLSWTGDWNTNYILDQISRNSSYGAYALAMKAILFKRDFLGQPLFEHYTANRVFTAHDILDKAPFSQTINDASAPSGRVAFCPMQTAGCFVYGPRIYLLHGSYEVTFTVKANAFGDGRLGSFDITNSSGNSFLAKREIFSFDLQPNIWTDFTLTFNSTELLTNVEFRTSSYGSADIYLDRVVVKRVSSNATSNFGMRTFGSRELFLAGGYTTDTGFLISQPGATSKTFWFGPYMNISEGRYRATFLLRVSPLPEKTGEKIITLSLSADFGSAVYAKYDVRSSDFLNNEQVSNWHKFTIDFIAKTPLEAVEFIGLNPSSNFTISLAYILVEQLSLSPDQNYELFSVQRGLYVGAGQIVTESSSQNNEVALSRKGTDWGILVYGPYVTLPNGVFTAVFRIKTQGTMQNVSLLFEVASQPSAQILSRKTLSFSGIHDGAWFNVTLPFSLKGLTANIEFRVTSNGATNLYVDQVLVMFH